MTNNLQRKLNQVCPVKPNTDSYHDCCDGSFAPSTLYINVNHFSLSCCLSRSILSLFYYYIITIDAQKPTFFQHPIFDTGLRCECFPSKIACIVAVLPSKISCCFWRNTPVIRSPCVTSTLPDFVNTAIQTVR